VNKSNSSVLYVVVSLGTLPHRLSSTFLLFRNKQFAVVENPGFWDWTFTLIDEDEKVLAQIDRNWRGIGFEVMSFLLENYQMMCISYI
jgi:hypothetical protein